MCERSPKNFCDCVGIAGIRAICVRFEAPRDTLHGKRTLTTEEMRKMPASLFSEVNSCATRLL